ncbi:uncharacterized protein LOC106658390 isoform X2 [Trichogramma pretiosum]|nr:uncharacterized protein LOC106658390 isoform X2 [Trichogramma pretiosum]
MWNYPQFLAREKSEKAGASKNPRTRSHSHPSTGRKVQAQQLPDDLPVKKKTIMKNTKHRVDQKKIQTERQKLEISSNIPELKKDEIINELKKEIEDWKHQGLASYNLITQLDTYSDNQQKQEARTIDKSVRSPRLVTTSTQTLDEHCKLSRAESLAPNEQQQQQQQQQQRDDSSASGGESMKLPKSEDERVPTVSWLPCAPMPDTSRTSVSLKTVADHLAEMDDEPRSKPPRRLCISPETRQALESADKLLANAERLLSQMDFKNVPLDISDDGSNCENVNDEELYIRNVVASTFQKGYYEPGPSAILDKDDFKIKHEKMAGARKEASKSTRMARARSNSPVRSFEPCLVCHSETKVNKVNRPLEQKTEEKERSGKAALNVQKAPAISISGECFSVQAANIIDIEPQESSQPRSYNNVATYEINHESKKTDVVVPIPVPEQEKEKSTPTVAASETNRDQFEQDDDDIRVSTIVEEFDDVIDLNVSLGEPGVLAEVDNLLDQQRTLIRHVCKASEKLDQFLMMNGSSLDTDSSPQMGKKSRVSLQKKTANDKQSEARRTPRVEIDLALDKSEESTSSRAKASRESSRNAKSIASVESLPSKSSRQSSGCQDESERAISRNETYDLAKPSEPRPDTSTTFGSDAKIVDSHARTNSGFVANLKVPVALKDNNSTAKKSVERKLTRSDPLESDRNEERVNKEKKNEADCDVTDHEDNISSNSSSMSTENRDSPVGSRESQAHGQESPSSSTSFSEHEDDRSTDKASENVNDSLRLMHVSHFEHRSATPDESPDEESAEKSQLEELSTESKIENSLQEARENLKRVMKAMDDELPSSDAASKKQSADFGNGLRLVSRIGASSLPSDDAGPLSRQNRSMVEILEETSRLKSNERQRLSLLKNLESCSIQAGADRCAVKGLFTSTLIGDAGLVNSCSKLKITDTSSDLYSEGEVCLSSATTSSLSLGEVRRKIQLTKSKSTTSSSNATSSTSAARSLGELVPPTD